MPKRLCHVCLEEFDGHYTCYTCDNCIDEKIQYCTQCGKILPLNNFYYNKNRGKYMSSCKSCQIEKTTKHHKKRCKNNKEFHEEALKRRREYHARKLNEPGWKDERNRKAREWRDEFIERDPMYLDRCNIYRHNYRTNLRGSYTLEEWIDCLEDNDYKCVYCGSKHSLTVEHIVAVSKGGWNYAFNITVACHSCNSSKGAKDIVEWYTAQPFYNENNLINIHKRYRMLQEIMIASLKGGDCNEQRQPK